MLASSFQRAPKPLVSWKEPSPICEATTLPLVSTPRITATGPA